MIKDIPKGFKIAALILLVLAMIPPVLIARQRTTLSDSRRIHFVQDMDNQHKFKAQAANSLFADGRAMRQPVANTVARGELRADDHFYKGTVAGENGQASWATAFPANFQIDQQFITRGQDRFNIYCSLCHGVAGYGDGPINNRAMELVNLGTNGTMWVQPKNIHEQAIREQPVGQIFNTITNGVRNMAGYASQIPVEDRWAIVAYVKALQRSQFAQPEDVPPAQRPNMP